MTEMLNTLAFELRVLMWLLAFIVMTALDYIWAKYNQATVHRQQWRAGAYAVLIYAFGAFGVISYTHDWTLLIPACAGAFVGTVLATRQHKAV